MFKIPESSMILSNYFHIQCIVLYSTSMSLSYILPLNSLLYIFHVDNLLYDCKVHAFFQVFFCVLVGTFSIGNITPHVTTVAGAKGAAAVLIDIIDNVSNN